MQLFNLATCLSILAVIEAATLVVTQTEIATVILENGVLSTILPSSSANSSSTLNSTSQSSTIINTPSLDAEIKPATVSPITYTAPSQAPTTLLTVSSYVAPVTVPTSTTPAAVTTQAATTEAAATTSSSSNIGGSVDQDFASSILNAHNEKRAAHGVGSLTWDDNLYQYAAAYASKYDCSGTLTHSGGQYGENLAVGYSDGVSALEAWYDEGSNYDYSSASSFDHFTQVIWKSTTKLGCAKKDCTAENWGQYVICSYDPAGNYIGEGKENLFS